MRARTSATALMAIVPIRRLGMGSERCEAPLSRSLAIVSVFRFGLVGRTTVVAVDFVVDKFVNFCFVDFSSDVR